MILTFLALNQVTFNYAVASESAPEQGPPLSQLRVPCTLCTISRVVAA